MICFNCGLKLNTGNELECQLCGSKFSTKCPECKFPNSGVAKFCFNCGSKILKTNGHNSSVENFNTLAESRKNVAVIFADISGFTALSEKMDPEEVREIINDCFNFITKPVYELEGTIDKFIGDCVMILFGAKYTHSDDAKRAVMCAMEMVSLIKEFSENHLSSKGISLNISVGVNYGLVVTGSVGNYFDKDYTVIGDIVNTAQRLQANAGKGMILVSESVYMETRDVINYSGVQELAVKNREGIVKSYIPIKLNSDYLFQRELLFVERQNEISFLNSLYEDSQISGNNYVIIEGEAGIGKTRLISEFISNISNNIRKIWVDCIPTSQNRAYFLISRILMKIMNINTKDSNSIKQHRLISFLDYILSDYKEEEIKRVGDFLGILIGINRDNDFQAILNSMNIENIKKEITKQLILFFKRVSKKYMFIVVADDIHWADSVSLNLLWDIKKLIADTESMFIFTSRSEIKDTHFKINEKIHVLKLESFNEQNVKALACSLLDCKNIDTVLNNAINKFTKGNPLYIREFVSKIKRTGKYYLKGDTAYINEQDIASLPQNIQNLVLSFIKELDDSARNILQVASVIGKDFSLSLINSIIECDVDDPQILSQPIKLNIIKLKSVYTHSGTVEKVYTFNHDIEREAIYESILNKSKKEYHKKIGEFIEVKYSKELENYFEILSIHFEGAGLSRKAGEYYLKTALNHKNNFNFSTALDYYNQYLNIPVSKDNLEDNLKVTEALRDIGYIHSVMGNYELAMEHLKKALKRAVYTDDIYLIKIMIAEIHKDKGMFDEALEILNEIDPKINQDNSLYGKLLQMKCNILRITGNPLALSIAKKSEKILLKAKDYNNLSETMKNAGIIYFTKGDVDNALFYLNKSLKYAEKVNNLESMAKVSGDLGIIYHSTGMISKARELFDKALGISQKISYPRGYIAACINLGILYMDKGFFSKAEYLFNESLTMSREIVSRLYECTSLTNLADIMYQKGDFDKAYILYQDSLQIAKEMNVPIEESINYLGIAKIYIKQGKIDFVSGTLDNVFKILNGTDEVEYLVDYYTCKGIFEMITNNNQTALEYCEKAISLSEECRNDRRKLNVLRLKGNLLVEIGQLDKALEIFNRAIEISSQIESHFEIAKSQYSKFKVAYLLKDKSIWEESLDKAKEHINMVDTCRWTDLILKTANPR